MGKRRKFTDEFKLEAVKLIKDGGVPFRRASGDLGVNETSLRKWVQQHEIDHGRGSDQALTTGEKDELRRLRRDVRRLRMEREVLKKATAFFAKESE